ncbi:MAG TPA: hypothetical protein VFM46_16950, partial [Pseudomonadales bacterium]|nr:hypothetical protein [Pseudomonadales bacterium]
KDACVVGLPDQRLGAVPVAAVELKPGAALDENDILAYLKNKLVAYQVPAQVKIVSTLPRTPSLKICQPDVLALFA